MRRLVESEQVAVCPEGESSQSAATVKRLLQTPPYHASTLPPIKTRRVARFFAPYFTMQGRVAYKGFTTELAAAKFIARLSILDDAIGVREWVSDGHPEGDYYLWRKKLDKEEFARRMREFGFQCTETTLPYDDEPSSCCPESYGFCGIKYKQEVMRRARALLAANPAPSQEPPTSEPKAETGSSHQSNEGLTPSVTEGEGEER